MAARTWLIMTQTAAMLRVTTRMAGLTGALASQAGAVVNRTPSELAVTGRLTAGADGAGVRIGAIEGRVG